MTDNDRVLRAMGVFPPKMAEESAFDRQIRLDRTAREQAASESTSGRLARVERENAACRAEIGRLRADNDRLTVQLADARKRLDGVSESLVEEAAAIEDAVFVVQRLKQERDEIAHDRDHIVGERDLAVRERDRLIVKFADVARSSWIVSRAGGRDCVRCEQEIRRNDAFEFLDGVDELAHIHCDPRR